MVKQVVHQRDQDLEKLLPHEDFLCTAKLNHSRWHTESALERQVAQWCRLDSVENGDCAGLSGVTLHHYLQALSDTALKLWAGLKRYYQSISTLALARLKHSSRCQDVSHLRPSVEWFLTIDDSHEH